MHVFTRVYVLCDYICCKYSLQFSYNTIYGLKGRAAPCRPGDSGSGGDQKGHHLPPPLPLLAAKGHRRQIPPTVVGQCLFQARRDARSSQGGEPCRPHLRQGPRKHSLARRTTLMATPRRPRLKLVSCLIFGRSKKPPLPSLYSSANPLPDLWRQCLGWSHRHRLLLRGACTAFWAKLPETYFFVNCLRNSN